MPPPHQQIAFLINESEIPTLPLLYRTNKITSNPKPLFAPNPAINAKIGLIRTDITKLHLPNGAIVNAANEALSPGGGVCGAIHSAAGDDLADECKMHRGCETGHAKITRAYQLLCKRIIHAVGPIYWLTKPNNSHARLLESCYSEVLRLCVSNKLTSVAFCALSTGIYGYPSYEAAESALKAVRTFLETEDGMDIKLVIFCNYERKDQDAYLDLMSVYFPPEPEEETAKGAENAETTEETEITGETEITEETETTEVAKSIEETEDDASPPKVEYPDGQRNVLPDPAAEDGKTKHTEPAVKSDKPDQKSAPFEDDELDDFVLIDVEGAEYLKVKSKKTLQ